LAVIFGEDLSFFIPSAILKKKFVKTFWRHGEIIVEQIFFAPPKLFLSPTTMFDYILASVDIVTCKVRL